MSLQNFTAATGQLGDMASWSSKLLSSCHHLNKVRKERRCNRLLNIPFSKIKTRDLLRKREMNDKIEEKNVELMKEIVKLKKEHKKFEDFLNCLRHACNCSLKHGSSARTKAGHLDRVSSYSHPGVTRIYPEEYGASSSEEFYQDVSCNFEPSTSAISAQHSLIRNQDSTRVTFDLTSTFKNGSGNINIQDRHTGSIAEHQLHELMKETEISTDNLVKIHMSPSQPQDSCRSSSTSRGDSNPVPSSSNQTQQTNLSELYWCSDDSGSASPLPEPTLKSKNIKLLCDVSLTEGTCINLNSFCSDSSLKIETEDDTNTLSLEDSDTLSQIFLTPQSPTFQTQSSLDSPTIFSHLDEDTLELPFGYQYSKDTCDALKLSIENESTADSNSEQVINSFDFTEPRASKSPVSVKKTLGLKNLAFTRRGFATRKNYEFFRSFSSLDSIGNDEKFTDSLTVISMDPHAPSKSIAHRSYSTSDMDNRLGNTEECYTQFFNVEKIKQDLMEEVSFECEVFMGSNDEEEEQINENKKPLEENFCKLEIR